MDRPILVVGGGIAGLTAAWLLRQRFPASPVVVLERAPQLGGLLSTFEYGRFGQFDCGMHWVTETGTPEIDQFFLDLLPPDEWVVLEGARRDLSGLYYRGRLQLNSQFPDLRRGNTDKFQAYVSDFFAALDAGSAESGDTLLQHARSRFGNRIADDVIAPIAEKVHGAEAQSLDPMARFLPLLDRVILFDELLSRELLPAKVIRDRLAFPEQRQLPLSYSSGRRSFYPRRYGIGRVVAALADRLKSANVEILTGASIRRVEIDGDVVAGVEVTTAAGTSRTFAPVDHLVWTVDSFGLAASLGLPLPARPALRRRTVIVNMLLKKPPKMGDLYCFFCADAPYDAYRITNYGAFCPEAARDEGHPICVELLVDAATPRTADELAAQAVGEAMAFGLFDDRSEVTFAKAESLVAGFPNVGRDSIKAIETVREALDGTGLKNLTRAGILARPNQFFQHDVLNDLSARISAL